MSPFLGERERASTREVGGGTPFKFASSLTWGLHPVYCELLQVQPVGLDRSCLLVKFQISGIMAFVRPWAERFLWGQLEGYPREAPQGAVELLCAK